MKCSLLTLSTFIDEELPQDRRAEVDAHLVGCPRCSAGASTLREEKARVGQLARVQVDPGSTRLMLEQLGIAVESTAPSWPPQPPPSALIAPEEVTVPDVPADVLPEPTASPAFAAAPDLADHWPVEHPSRSWEEDLPAPIDSAPARREALPASAPSPPPGPPLAPPPPPGLSSPVHRPQPPTRAAVPSGPTALWGRVRDAVAVRLALSRTGARADAADIIIGTPVQRPVTPPFPSAPPRPGPVTDASPANGSIELSGTPGIHLAPRPVREVAPAQPVDPAPPVVPPAAAVPDWHAFSASSYPAVELPADEPAQAPERRHLGRHSRALARGGSTTLGRLGTAAASVAAGARQGVAGGSAGVRARLRRMPKAGPDNRLYAGIAVLGLLFVVVLLIGHLASPAHRTTAASRPAVPTAVAARPQPTAAAPVAVAPVPATVAPAVAQSYGTGAVGFQVNGVRYGRQATYTRVVFDLSALGRSVTGTPRVTVAFATPTTVLVTLAGTAPSATVATPVGTVITSVTLVQGGSQRAEYRITLSRAATATSFFLGSPTRFVLDLH